MASLLIYFTLTVTALRAMTASRSHLSLQHLQAGHQIQNSCRQPSACRLWRGVPTSGLWFVTFSVKSMKCQSPRSPSIFRISPLLDEWSVAAGETHVNKIQQFLSRWSQPGWDKPGVTSQGPECYARCAPRAGASAQCMWVNTSVLLPSHHSPTSAQTCPVAKRLVLCIFWPWFCSQQFPWGC